MKTSWHDLSLEKVLVELGSTEKGLSIDEANRRLKENGLNKIPEAKVDSYFIIFLRQFQSPLIYILIVASVIIFYTSSIADSMIILAVLFFNAVVGTIQEGKARNTLLALKRFVETKATVLRDGNEIVIPDTEITVGDIIILQEGDKIPADARIILSNNLKVDEASLSGESEPVFKISETLSLEEKKEKRNMVFMGTYIVSGNGRAIVVATGLETVIGKIAKEISNIVSEVPLKKDIRNLSRLIIVCVSIISAFLFIMGVFSGKSVVEMFSTIVTLSVSIIPEGLPIVMTLVLASGVWRMSKRNVLVKRLQSIESLGQARIIAVDKTGTITKNEMVIQQVYADNNFFEIGGVGYEPKGEVSLNSIIVDSVNHPELLLLGKLVTLCANSHLVYSEEKKKWNISGDPTDGAMLVFAQKIGFYKDDILRELPVVSEVPFNYKTKYRAVLNKVDDNHIISVVGAPEEILNLSEKIWHQGSSHLLSKKEKDDLEAAFISMSKKGLRVVAVAKKDTSSKTIKPDNIDKLVFVGFVGMKDALRHEVKDSMLKAMLAGIKVVMITGDYRHTAEAIAKEAGIYSDGDEIFTGEEIDAMSDKELSEKIARVTVFTRVTPEHKLRIVNAYKLRGEIIAMTGDGVNDAPSLVAADLGVAMGITGTEVAKEASDMILLDDNFGSIISAVEEGRGIYKTIKKVILYLFSTSAGEVFTIAGALFIGIPLPILPAQIIWLNFVTDGFLDVALAMDPKGRVLVSGKFDRPKKYLVDKLMLKRMIIMAIPMAIGALYVFSKYYETDITKAWTMTLTVLAVFQWFNAWNCRSDNASIFMTSPFSNLYLVFAMIITVSLQLLAVYTPVLQKILHTTSLDLNEWFMIICIAFSIIVVEEIRKFFYRKSIK